MKGQGREKPVEYFNAGLDESRQRVGAGEKAEGRSEGESAGDLF